MGTGRLFSRLTIGAPVVAGALAGGTYALTASNTVPDSTAGSGAGAIGGYTASQVKIRLASGGSWYTCANTSGSVSCTTTSPQATVAAATQLTVVATQ